MANDPEAASIIWYNQRNKRQWIDSMIEFEKSEQNFFNLSKLTKYTRGGSL